VPGASAPVPWHRPSHTFSEVSAIVYLLYKVTVYRTFENVYPPSALLPGPRAHRMRERRRLRRDSRGRHDCGVLRHALYKFSKVSALVYLLCQVTVYRTFENVCPPRSGPILALVVAGAAIAAAAGSFARPLQSAAGWAGTWVVDNPQYRLTH
jgi:hypothetical protein